MFEIRDSMFVHIVGNAAHSMKDKTSCDACRALLVSESQDIMFTDSYFESLQRGGVSIPSDFLMHVFQHIYCLF